MDRNLTCLVIDDDTDDQAIFSFALAQAYPSAQCAFARHCIDAIERLHSRDIPVPDYIFMDWNMPLMKAEECLAELRRIDGVDKTTIFVMSGLQPPISEEEHAVLNIAGVEIKPDSIDELTAILSRLIGR